MAAVPPRHSKHEPSPSEPLDPRHRRHEIVDLLAGGVFQLVLRRPPGSQTRDRASSPSATRKSGKGVLPC